VIQRCTWATGRPTEVEVAHAQADGRLAGCAANLAVQLCGPLCDAVLGNPAGSGHATLEHAERANLFLVPLDDDRHWYRYHHLFADLLRQRLQSSTSSKENVTEFHRRASQWLED